MRTTYNPSDKVETLMVFSTEVIANFPSIVYNSTLAMFAPLMVIISVAGFGATVMLAISDFSIFTLPDVDAI